MRARKRMPSAVRQMAPRPPMTLVPPTTTAAKAPKTTSIPLPACPGAVRETTMAPPGARAGAPDPPADAGRQPAEGEGGDLHRARVDARQPRRLRVAAHRVQPAPELRARQDEAAGGRRHDEDPDRVLHAEELVGPQREEALIVDGDQEALGDDV